MFAISIGLPNLCKMMCTRQVTLLTLMVGIFWSLPGWAIHKPAYVIYNAKGKRVGYVKMLKSLAKADVILFGEEHNNPIVHWLQLETLKDLHLKRKLILGAEMFETDNQTALDFYLEGKSDKEGLDTMARLWPNYTTDYAPLVDFAKKNNLPFIATNIPRIYAKMVHKSGFDVLFSLPDYQQAWMAPLPIPFEIDLPAYQHILSMMGTHGSPNLVRAQAIKDATMAHFILKNSKEDHLFLHFNGAYHSDNYEGILWYLEINNPNLQYISLTTVSQANVEKLLPENLGLADFIICVDEDMTKTY